MSVKFELFEGKPISLIGKQKLDEVFKLWKLKGFWPKKFECYKNARKLYIDSNGFFDYCEGYVVPNIENHAWNIFDDSIIDISIAPDNGFYSIDGLPKMLSRTPEIGYIYYGSIIPNENIFAKEKEVGHFEGGSHNSKEKNKYHILTKEEMEIAKLNVLQIWKNKFKI